VINTLLKGPPAKYKEMEITSDIPAGTKLISASPGENNVLSVDLDIELSQFLHAQQEENFLEQLVLTITENSSFQKINLYFNGEALESLPFGTEIKNPISREIQ
jgi:spore germination protein GerM